MQEDSEDSEIEFVGYRTRPRVQPCRPKSIASPHAKQAMTSASASASTRQIVKRELSASPELEEPEASNVRATHDGGSEDKPDGEVNHIKPTGANKRLFSANFTFESFEEYDELFVHWNAKHFPNRPVWRRKNGQYASRPEIVCRNTPRCNFKVVLKLEEGVFILSSANITHSKLCQPRQTPSITRKVPREATKGTGTGEVLPAEAINTLPDPFAAGLQYRISKEELNERVFEWHDKLYPDKTIIHRPYKGSKGINAYYICKSKRSKSKRKSVCGFRILFHPLPNGEGFKAALSNVVKHPAHCIPLAIDARLNLPAKGSDSGKTSRPFKETSSVSRKHECSDIDEDDDEDEQDDEDQTSSGGSSSDGEMDSDAEMDHSDDEYAPSNASSEIPNRVARSVASGLRRVPTQRHAAQAAAGPSQANKAADARTPTPGKERPSLQKAGILQGDPRQLLRDSDIPQSTAERLALHGIKTRGDLFDLKIRGEDFDGVCQLVYAKDPQIPGNHSRVAAYIAGRRLFPGTE